MPKDEWGVKRVCPNCQGRFYDLQKEDMVCPYCATEFNLKSLTQDKNSIVKAEEKAKESEEATVVDEAADVLDDDNDSDIEVDDSLLDDDDDDNVSLEEIADVPVEEDDS